MSLPQHFPPRFVSLRRRKCVDYFFSFHAAAPRLIISHLLLKSVTDPLCLLSSPALTVIIRQETAASIVRATSTTDLTDVSHTTARKIRHLFYFHTSMLIFETGMYAFLANEAVTLFWDGFLACRLPKSFSTFCSFRAPRFCNSSWEICKILTCPFEKLLST